MTAVFWALCHAALIEQEFWLEDGRQVSFIQTDFGIFKSEHSSIICKGILKLIHSSGALNPAL